MFFLVVYVGARAGFVLGRRYLEGVGGATWVGVEAGSLVAIVYPFELLCWVVHLYFCL